MRFVEGDPVPLVRQSATEPETDYRSQFRVTHQHRYETLESRKNESEGREAARKKQARLRRNTK
jgi:hypothetical protein